MKELNLYMILVGCKPAGRFTEQHDIFFGIGDSMNELKTAMQDYWKEAPKIHIDAWREVKMVDGFRIVVRYKKEAEALTKTKQLFFINLGGYKENEFEEFHYKMLVVASDAAAAIRASKETAFYRHTGLKGAPSHIDDKYGVDVDDIVNIEDILSTKYKDQFSLEIVKAENFQEDKVHLGYLKWENI